MAGSWARNKIPVHLPMLTSLSTFFTNCQQFKCQPYRTTRNTPLAGFTKIGKLAFARWHTLLSMPLHTIIFSSAMPGVNIQHTRQTFKQSRFSLVFWSKIKSNSIQTDNVVVLTKARLLKFFFRIKHRISYGGSTRLHILESVWIFRIHTVRTCTWRIEREFLSLSWAASFSGLRITKDIGL